MVYVDIPTSECFEDDDANCEAAWKNIRNFRTMDEAVKFLRFHLGEASVKDDGCVRLVTGTDEPEGDDLCDTCMRSGVQISRTEDDKTICVDCDGHDTTGDCWTRLLEAAHEILGNAIDSCSYGPCVDIDEPGGEAYERDENGNAWYDDLWRLRQAAHECDKAQQKPVNCRFDDTQGPTQN